MLVEKMSKYDLKEKVNTNIKCLLDNDYYNVSSRDPIALLSPERFDIVAKYIFVKYVIENIDCSFGSDIYTEHIRVFNNFLENDNSIKIGKAAFIESFTGLIYSIKNDGFQENSIIPISPNLILLDGAHRLACALYFKKEIKTVEVEYTNPNFKFDYKFFQERGLDQIYLDTMALEYAALKLNTNLVLVWPRAIGKDKELKGLLGNNGKIVYEKKINLSLQGLVNLMIAVYKDEPWLGDYKNNFEGARTKAQMCFSENNPLRVFLFESNCDLISMKDKIRNIYNVEKHALHINDSHIETIEIAQILFNQNSIHQLNNSVLREFKKFNELFYKFTSWVYNNNYKSESFVLIGGVLATYGVLQSSDLDYITSISSIPDQITPEIEKEQKKLNYIKLGASDLIYNPKYYFMYRNFKFSNLEIVRSIKESRGNVNDVNSIELIDRLLNNNSIHNSFVEKLRELSRLSFYKRNAKITLLKFRYYLYFLKGILKQMLGYEKNRS